MTYDMICRKCSYVSERCMSFVREVSDDPYMHLPFVSSGILGSVLACAVKVTGCTASYWTLFQAMFVVCATAHGAFISPFQQEPSRRTTFQSVIKSTLHVAWALRTGAINAIFFDLFKNSSVGLRIQNRYLFCIWDVVTLVVLLPPFANPLCTLTTGAMIVAGVGIVSFACKFFGEQPEILLSQEPGPLIVRPPPRADTNRRPQEEKEVFFDRYFKKYYFKPPGIIELDHFLGDYSQQAGGLVSSVARRMAYKNIRLPGRPLQPCDVFMIPKPQEQIDFEQDEERRKHEKRGLLSIFSDVMDYLRNSFSLDVIPLESFRKRMQELTIVREQVANQLVVDLTSMLETTWKDSYSSVLFCGPRQLTQLGWEEEDAKNLHGLFLFYKPLPTEEPSSRELIVPPICCTS